MANKQPIRIDTIQIEFDVPKSPFEDVEKSIKDVTSGVDDSTKEIQKTFKDTFKAITKSADEISLENGIKDLEYMQDEIKYLSNEYEKAKDKMKTGMTAGIRLEAKQDFNVIEQDLKQLVADYNKTSKSVSDLQRKISNTSAFKKLTSAAKKPFVDMGNSIKTKAIKSLDALKQSIKNVDFKPLKESAKKHLDGIAEHANKAREHFGKMGQAIGKIPALLAGIGLTVGMKEVLDFMSKMEQTKVDMKFSTTMNDKQLKEAQKLMKESMSKGMTGDLAEINQAYQLANQTLGLTGKEQQRAAENSIYLTRLLGSDLTEAYAAARQMNDKFGMEANESFNLLAQSKKHGLNLDGDFLSRFDEYSDAFKDLGFNGYDMFDMIKTGMDSGAHSTDKLADGMLEFSIRSKDMTESTAKAYTALGLDADTMFTKFAAGGDTAKTAFKEVTDAIAGVKSDKERNNLAVALFGTMAEDMAPEVFLAMGKAQEIVEKGTGFIDKYAEESSKTWAALWTGATNDFSSAFDTAFSDTFQNSDEVKEQIKQIVTELANGLVKALQWIVNNKDSLLKWAKALGSAFLVFKAGGIVGNGIKGISETFKTIGKIGSTLKLDEAFAFLRGKGLSGLKLLGGKGLTGLKNFAKFIGSGFVKSLSLLKAGFLKMIPAIWSAITATWSFTVALLANPITWIVIGIIALIAAIILLVKNWDTVKAAFATAAQWFSEKVITPVKNFFVNLGKSISDAFVAAWNWIKGVWNAVTAWFNNTIIQPVKTKFTSLKDGIKTALSSAWTSVKGVWNAVTAWFNNTIIQPVKTKFTSLKDGIKTALSSAWTSVKGVWDKAAQWFEDTVIGPIKKGFDKLTEGWNAVKEGFGTAKSKIGGGLKSVGQAIGIPGLASGGVFKANNPFLAVLGDQKQGNNIETPENLLRSIVREETHDYTPANSVSMARTNESYSYNPIFNISINGSIDNRNTERKIKEIFKKSMDEYAQSMMRRSPRLTGV